MLPLCFVDMLAFRSFATAAALALLVACHRSAPVPVRDVAGDIILVEQTSEKGPRKFMGDTVSVTVREGRKWRTEIFFSDGSTLVYVYNGEDTSNSSHRTPLQKGEMYTANSLDALHRFAAGTARAKWFRYVGNIPWEGRSCDLYEGIAPHGAMFVKGLRLFVDRGSGQIVYQDQRLDDMEENKRFSYPVRPVLSSGDLFDATDTRVRAFEFLDRQIIERYDNLQIYEETFIKGKK